MPKFHVLNDFQNKHTGQYHKKGTAFVTDDKTQIDHLTAANCLRPHNPRTDKYISEDNNGEGLEKDGVGDAGDDDEAGENGEGSGADDEAGENGEGEESEKEGDEAAPKEQTQPARRALFSKGKK